MSLDHLFSPLSLGPVELRNRIVSTSHQTSLVADSIPTDDLVAYHEARAAGGAGLISIEATAPDPSGLLTAHQIAGYRPEVVPAYRAIADAVHGHGATVFVQLCHGGREQILEGYRPPAVAPSAVPSLRFHTEARALTRGEIGEIVDGHRLCGAHARAGGLDGIECLAGYSYLPGQFLSPRTNRRDDEYGGDLAGRMRFLVEALEAMRDGIGADRAVGIRLTAESVTSAGLQADETLEVFAALRERGLVDYVSTSIGDSSSYVGSMWIAPPAPLGSERVAAAAHRVRDVAGVPVIATTRVTDPEVADLMIARGDADAVGMTRALIADPQMPNKAAAGRPEEIERCTGCNQACIGHYHAGMPINCTMNPWTGRERTLRRPTRSQRRIVIVGGGPAGCAAVRAAPGAHVTLFERSADGLGGQWRHALAGPSHEPIARTTLESLERWARDADVRLGVEATVEAVVAEAPDLVVLASGATPHRPTLTFGDGSPRVLDAWDVLDGVAAGGSAVGAAVAVAAGGPPAAARQTAAGAVVQGSVVVWEWGGDWTGFIAAEALATGGHQVRLASASAAFGEGMHQYQRTLYLGRLHELGVELVGHVEPIALAGGDVECRNVFSDRPVTLPDVGTLVLAAGREPRCELYEPLLEAGLTVERAGDCLGARTAEEAVHEGTVAALAPAPV